MSTFFSPKTRSCPLPETAFTTASMEIKLPLAIPHLCVQRRKPSPGYIPYCGLTHTQPPPTASRPSLLRQGACSFLRLRPSQPGSLNVQLRGPSPSSRRWRWRSEDVLAPGSKPAARGARSAYRHLRRQRAGRLGRTEPAGPYLLSIRTCVAAAAITSSNTTYIIYKKNKVCTASHELYTRIPSSLLKPPRGF